jgi:hypothetical protein
MGRGGHLRYNHHKTLVPDLFRDPLDLYPRSALASLNILSSSQLYTRHFRLVLSLTLRCERKNTTLVIKSLQVISTAQL